MFDGMAMTTLLATGILDALFTASLFLFHRLFGFAYTPLFVIYVLLRWRLFLLLCKEGYGVVLFFDSFWACLAVLFVIQDCEIAVSFLFSSCSSLLGVSCMGWHGVAQLTWSASIIGDR